ncbi:GntR family transcriptional regulator [Leucobacter soli]|uniref:GntR family transcriptional regulator n=1 Tax=Leucobacter soli TaxID=2812850 RepID=UPI0036109482
MQDHPSAAAELPIVLDRAAPEPLPAQLAGALREAIDRGALRAGEPVTATREFARRLGVARGVVVAAYEQLIAEGYLAAGQGRGTRVQPELKQPDPATGRRAPQLATARQAPPAPRPAIRPLAPGVPDTSAVDTPAWRAAWRGAVARAHLEAPELGDPALREQIAEHLRRMRGTARSAEDVIVTAGAREGLTLLLTALGSTRGSASRWAWRTPDTLRCAASRSGTARRSSRCRSTRRASTPGRSPRAVPKAASTS